MAIFGKIIGGAIGFAIGGPLGAVAGAAFGHNFDEEDHYNNGISAKCPHCNSTIQIEGKGHWKCGICNNIFSYGIPAEEISPEDSIEYIFFLTLFVCLGKIAKADGVISPEEVKAFKDFVRNDLDFNDEDVKHARDIFYKAGNSTVSFADIVKQFYETCNGEKTLILKMMELQLKVATADGKLDINKERLILITKTIFNISDAEYKQIKSLFIKDVDVYYAILGCSKNDSDETIKTIYRKLVKEYHPDTITSKGLPDEFIKFANTKFNEIQTAYEAITKDRIVNAPPGERFKYDLTLPCRINEKYTIKTLEEIINLLWKEPKLMGRIIREEEKSDLYPWLEAHSKTTSIKFKEATRKYKENISSDRMISELYNSLVSYKFSNDRSLPCRLNDKYIINTLDEIINLFRKESLMMEKIIREDQVSELYPWLEIHNNELAAKFREAVIKYKGDSSSRKMISELYNLLIIDKFKSNSSLPCRLNNQYSVRTIEDIIGLLVTEPNLMGRIIKEEEISDLYPWLQVNHENLVNQFKNSAQKLKHSDPIKLARNLYFKLAGKKIKPFIGDELEITCIEELIDLDVKYQYKILSLISRNQNSILYLWLQEEINSFNEKIRDIGLNSWTDFISILNSDCLYDMGKWKTNEQKKAEDLRRVNNEHEKIVKQKEEEIIKLNNERERIIKQKEEEIIKLNNERERIIKQKEDEKHGVYKKILIILLSVTVVCIVLFMWGINQDQDENNTNKNIIETQKSEEQLLLVQEDNPAEKVIVDISNTDKIQSDKELEKIQINKDLVDKKNVSKDGLQPVVVIKPELNNPIIVENNKIYALGEKGPAGGFIFYDKGSYSDGWRYLEAAPYDQGKIAWDSGKKIESYTPFYGIGSGKSNTQIIISAFGEGYYAAKLCADYRGGDKNDWFLPSLEELKCMFFNLKQNNVGGLAREYYWSSSKQGAGDAIGYDFRDGSQFNGGTIYNFRVRAIRAF
jgi:DnaJ like chaperone protein